MQKKELKNELPKLLFCPFCGGRAGIMEHLSRIGTPLYYVDCLNADCKMNVSTYSVRTEEEAINAWNQRRRVDDVVEALEENAFPDFEEEYTCNGAELLFLSDAIQIIKEKLNE